MKRDRGEGEERENERREKNKCEWDRYHIIREKQDVEDYIILY